MDLEALKKQLVKHEGFELMPYPCTKKKMTIGVGRNLDDCGISEDEMNLMLKNDIEKVIKDLVGLFDDWYHYSVNRQNALADMRFQMGADGFRSFKKMIDAVRLGKWGVAAAEAFDSQWRTQTPERAKTIIKMLRG